MIGIYKITNIINQKCYIGQSTDLIQRIRKHIKTLVNGTNSNEHLQNAYNKYGQGNFTIEIIEECDIENLDNREIFWIDYYKSYDSQFGYNKTKGGTGGNGYFELCNEDEKNCIKLKKSERVSGINNPNYGMNCYTDGIVIKYIKDDEIELYESQGWRPGVPDFVREKERIANTGPANGFYGKKHSDETKQKLSDNRTGDKNWNFGKVIYHKDNEQKYVDPTEIEYYETNGWIKGVSEDTKRKISEKNKGKKITEDILRPRSNVYLYDGEEYIGWRKMQTHLRNNGYPQISEAAIVKLSNNQSVRGYDDLFGEITIKEK